MKTKLKRFQRSLYVDGLILAKAEQIASLDLEKEPTAFLREWLRLGIAEYEEKHGPIQVEDSEILEKFNL